MTPKDKVALVRKEMKKNNIDAFIVYSADPHMSEYLPAEWKEREWLSGFTGSAGFLVITLGKAGLWTDGRYFTQAEEELEGSGIKMYKDKVVDAVDYVQWIIDETPPQAVVGVNPLATSNADWEKLKNELTQNDRNLVAADVLKEVWKNREAPIQNEIFPQPVERAGKSVEDKIAAIRDKMKAEGATAHIISALDDVTWTVNLRGSDVDFNPVFLGYVYIDLNSAVLFINKHQLNKEAETSLKQAQVEVKEYNSFFDFLSGIENEKIWIASNCNQAVFRALENHNQFVKKPAPGNLMKAMKNEVELEGFRKVMVRDGVAMVNFLHWLTHTAGKEKLNEYSVGQKLYDFRAKGENFVGTSFSSIIGYKGNGAIIHYSAKKEGSAEITDDGSILVDSGGQYLEGTTDITRTFPLGKVSDEFRHDYTQVLRGLIHLSQAKFPKGTRGSQLDVLARLPLWKEAKDYRHGTGHGIGSFLNVHEGPQNIRTEYNPVNLMPGMVLSNEPGYYIVGEYGIRHENLMVVKEFKESEWNSFYEFETLTFCPFFTGPLKKELLSEEEKKWINDYHQQCEEKLAPHLEGEVKEWFLELVKPI